MTFKRKLLVAALPFAFCLSGLAQATTMKMAEIHPAGYPTVVAQEAMGKKIEAATKMFLYGLTGSLFTLGGIVGASLALGGMEKGCDFSIPRLVQVAKDRGKPMEELIARVEKSREALNHTKTDLENKTAQAKFDEAEHELLQKRNAGLQHTVHLA